MGNLTLLKRYVTLILETAAPALTEPFELTGQAVKAKPHHNDFAIYREFPLVLSPEAAAILNIGPGDLVDGALDGEHEIMIDVKDSYRHSTFKGSHLQPPDPDEYELEDWTPESINGIMLSPEDAQRLKAYLGDELTDNEQDALSEKAAEASYDEGPEWDDGRDDFDY